MKKFLFLSGRASQITFAKIGLENFLLLTVILVLRMECSMFLGLPRNVARSFVLVSDISENFNSTHRIKASFSLPLLD